MRPQYNRQTRRWDIRDRRGDLVRRGLRTQRAAWRAIQHMERRAA